MRRRSEIIKVFLLTVGLTLLCAFASAYFTAFDLGFYENQWEELGVPQAAGIPMDDLLSAGRVLARYFRGQIDTPQTTVTVRGKPRELFNEKELTHLSDVKVLFKNGLLILEILGIQLVGIGFFLTRTQERRPISRAFLIAGTATLAVIALLAIPAKTDFTGFWTRFHLLTFTNDLWLLDPSTDLLINIFPEGFFSAAALRIALTAAGISLIYIALSFLVRHFSPDHRH